MRTFWIGATFLLVLTTSVQGQQRFEAAVSGPNGFGCFILPIFSDGVQWIGPDRFESPTQIRTIASGDGAHVFAILKGSGARIVRVLPDGTQTPFFQDLTYNAYSLDVAADGRIFAVFYQNGVYSLARISAAGVLEAIAPLPFASSNTSVTVAADGCTVYYISHFDNVVKRFNGCTGTALPDFLTVAAEVVSDVYALPNGQVLVALNGGINLYDAAGALIRTVASMSTYGLNNQFVGQVAATRDLSQVWFAASECDSQGLLLRVSFNNGTELARENISLNLPNALVIGATTSDVPIGNVTLWLLAIGIAAIAILRL